MLFQFGMYIHDISESILLIFWGPKKNWGRGWGQFMTKKCHFGCFKTLLTCREKTVLNILFQFGIYIQDITESILLIVWGSKKIWDGVGA